MRLQSGLRSVGSELPRMGMVGFNFRKIALAVGLD